ncbi:hypothetical protein HDU92_005863 [Lobulomyces angularis]|nr:hypothetical protein HDU92_005863 [Lobulomyces angularis]
MSDLWKDRLRSRETLVTNKSEKIKNVSEQSKTSKRKRQTHKKVTSIAKKKLKTVNTKKPTRFDKNNFREKEISTEDEFWSSPPAKLRVASFKTAIAQDKLKKIDDDGCWLMTPFSKKKSNTFSIRFSTPNLESPFKRFNVSQENLQQLPNLMTNLSDDSDDDTDQNLLFSDDEFENKTPSYEDQNSNFLALNITDGLFPAKVILLIFKYLLNSSSKFDLNFLILCKSWSLLGRAALWENLQFQTVGKMKGVFNIVCKKDATRNLILNQGLSKYGRAFLYSNFSSENEKKCIKVTNASENEKRIRTETLKAVEYSNLVKSFSYSFTQPKDNKTNFPVQCFFANDLFPNLTKIVFFGSPAWLNDSLFKVISRNNSITKNLQNFQLSNPGLTKFKFISKFKNLKILILENSLINDSELDFLGKNLKSLVKLCLPLSKHISSNGIDQFFVCNIHMS